jgi:RNA polymerase sigma factor (sigma-70 family)
MIHNNNNKAAPSSASRYAPRLSDAEHDQYLQEVLEMRRIKSVLKQQPFQNKGGGGNAKSTAAASRASSSAPTTTTTKFVSEQSQLCGYGDDIQAYEAALIAGETARERLITNHLGLVRFVVNDLTRHRKLHSITPEDLVQEGVLGLARALEKYEPSHQTKLSTYSVFWIRAVVLRAIAEKDSPVYVPSHIQQTASRLKHRQHHNGYWHEAMEAKQLAESLGVSDRHLHDAIQVQKRQFLSYETMVRDGQNFMDDQQQQNQQQQNDNSSAVDLPYLKQALSLFLGPREVEALSWRYGLNTDGNTSLSPSPAASSTTTTRSSPPPPVAGIAMGGKWGEAMSFSEVGVQMHVSAEYGRRLVHRALKKLQLAVAEGTLEMAALVPS